MLVILSISCDVMRIRSVYEIVKAIQTCCRGAVEILHPSQVKRQSESQLDYHRPHSCQTINGFLT